VLIPSLSYPANRGGEGERRGKRLAVSTTRNREAEGGGKEACFPTFSEILHKEERGKEGENAGNGLRCRGALEGGKRRGSFLNSFYFSLGGGGNTRSF